jgi:DNA helicase-2/ATP-dependent DNA helicase PcrA
VCVDEFQDVDAAQLRLVRVLAAPEDKLFVVGDDDQP